MGHAKAQGRIWTANTTVITQQEGTSPRSIVRRSPARPRSWGVRGCDGKASSHHPARGQPLPPLEPPAAKSAAKCPQETTHPVQPNPVATLGLVGSWALSGASHPMVSLLPGSMPNPGAFGGKGRQPARDYRPISPVQAPGLRCNPGSQPREAQAMGSLLWP